MNRFPAAVCVVALALATLSVGCKKTPKAPTPIPESARTTIRENPNPFPPVGGNQNLAQGNPLAGNGNGGPSGTELEPGTTINTTNLEEFEDMFKDPDAFAANTIHFEFDRASIRPADQGSLEAVAAHLKSNPTHKVLVEGHCDERGTESYNLALGERRALSAREYLVTLGIAADRIRTLSYGESIPADEGTTDSAFAANRRDEFILLLPKN